jgi:hypothetical protein
MAKSPKRTSEVPTSEILDLTKIVARMEGKVDTIKDDLLPPVSVAAGEARDGVLVLTNRVEQLEQAPDPVYECTRDEEIAALEQLAGEHGETLATNDERVAGITKSKSWLARILIPLTLAAAGAAATAIDRSATVRERAATNAEAIERHEETIKALRSDDAAGRREIIEAVEAVPAKVQLPEPDLDDAMESAPLTEEERRRVRSIIERAEKRNGKGRRGR